MDKEIYKEFIKDIELKEVFLSKVISKREVLVINSSELDIKVEFNPTFDKVEQNENEFTSKAEFDLIARTNNKIIFQIACEFIVVNYISNKELMKPDCIDAYIQNNLPIIVWPYGRELINSMTTRMGFPPLILGNRKIV